MRFITAAISTLFFTLVSADASPITTAPDTTATDAANWSTYPSVAKTASINGFADKIYDQLPDCAKPCMFADTSKTPCPYWDTGCLCVIPNFVAAVADCVAQRCKGKDVEKMRSLATSECSEAGVWTPYWIVPATADSSLQAAATQTA
ncbi:unnamed protein product [Candida verbasci]|uniref:CFEM domain-containing protein n=1 Tax=Candida verbasci TaxID=1227364 RepID=A0A9W4TVT0_9ASCO|nr:unnamed protein product [Candida verbasci]